MMKLPLITYGRVSSEHKAVKIGHFINKIFFFAEIENAIIILLTLCGATQIIARVLVGVCAKNVTIYRSARCNTQALSNAPPMDTYALLLLMPLIFATFTKGVKKCYLLITTGITVSTITWSVIYLQGYSNIFIILMAIFPPMILYDNERTMMFLFLKSKLALAEETRLRKVTEEKFQESVVEANRLEAVTSSRATELKVREGSMIYIRGVCEGEYREGVRSEHFW